MSIIPNCYWLFLALFLTSLNGISQNNTLAWQEGIKLSKNDFMSKDSIGYLDIVVSYQYELQQSKFDKVTPFVRSEAVFNRTNSRIIDQLGRGLKYSQIQFDIEGYSTKILKHFVFQIGEVPQEMVRQKLDSAYSRVNDIIVELKKDFERDILRYPSDSTLSMWNNKITHLISETPVYKQIEIPRKMNVGIYIGSSNSFLFGKTRDYFSNSFGINFGFDLDFNKSRLAVDMNLGANKTKNDFENKGTWLNRSRTNLTNFEFTYGLKYNAQKWLTIPYVGFAINEFTPRRADKDDKRRLIGYSPVIGIELNRIFSQLENISELTRFVIKGKLSVNPSNFIKNMGGPQVNLRIGIGFNTVKTKKQMKAQ